jgi:hypothetical protein
MREIIKVADRVVAAANKIPDRLIIQFAERMTLA